MKIEVIIPECTPYRGSEKAAGLDLRAHSLTGVPPAYLMPGTKYIFGLGIRTNIPEGWVALVAPRSGLGFNYEVQLANTLGVIDSDFEGEWLLAIVVRGDKPMPYKEFDRICQMIVVPHYDYNKVEYTAIDRKSERGEDGLGHSGTQ